MVIFCWTQVEAPTRMARIREPGIGSASPRFIPKNVGFRGAASKIGKKDNHG
jgi:hypothetical protein